MCSCWKEEVHVTSITLDASALTVELGSTAQLTAVISPSNADNKIVIWSSSNASVARVSSEGMVTAVAPGQTEITAKSDDLGRTAVCLVTVPEIAVAVQSLSLDKEELVLQKGESAELKATIEPENASNTQLRWMSTDEKVASVTDKGVVSALAPGVAAIVVSTVDGGFTARCELTVEQHAGSMTLSAESLTLKELQMAILTATVLPEDTVDKSIVWSSSDENVATVNSGVVHAVKAGEADIIAATKDGGLSKSCHVTVTCDVAAVRLAEHTVVLKIGETHSLVADVLPERATNKAIKWASADQTKATVSAAGVVVAVAPGTVEVSVVSEDNASAVDACTVIIEKNAVSSISITPASLELVEGEGAKLSATVLPADASDPTFSWSSSDERVATVDGEGNVLAVAPGQCAVCATTIDGGKHAHCVVTVRSRVNAVVVSPAAATLYVGQTQKFEYTLEPAGVTGVEIEWSVSNPDAASIASDGTLTAKARTEAPVDVIAKVAGSEVSGKASVTVLQQVTGISIKDNKTSVTMWAGDSEEFELEFAPANVSSTEYAVSTVPVSGMFSVSKTGNKVVVTALRAGSGDIYFTALGKPDSAPAVTAKANIVVRAHVAGISFTNVSGGARTMAIGDKFTPTISITPAGAYNQAVSWSSSNPACVSIDSATGEIEAKQNGTSVITVTSQDVPSVSASFTVTVRETVVSSVVINPDSIAIDEGSSVTLSATVSPSDVSDKSVTWTSSDTSVATVNASGVVYAVHEGTATITATSVATPSVYGTCAVTVNHRVVTPSSVTMDKTALTLEVGGSSVVRAIVLPENADNKSVTWSSSNNSVATVTSEGYVQAVAPGEADITAVTTVGGLIATCHVTVKAPVVAVTSISLNHESEVMDFNSSLTLVATVLPENATNKAVSWSSSNPSVASVSDAGVVSSGNTTGTAVITAKSVSDESITATCTIEVKNVIHVTEITMTQRNLSLYIGERKQLFVTISPSNADNKSINWSVAQGGVASVDSDGWVTGMLAGQTTVYATSVDGGKRTSCVVTVSANAVKRIDLAYTNITLAVGESYVLGAKVVGQDEDRPASVLSVSWSSADTSIASVDSNGKITANAVGEVDITVRSLESGSSVQSKCRVKVISTGGSGGNEGVGFDDWNF